MGEDVLVRLHRALPTLRRSEQRIANAALNDPAQVSGMSITALAARCEVSTTTVGRFCRTIGFEGYRSFCLALAGAVAGENGRRHQFGVADGDIDPADSTREMIRKLAFQEARAVQDTAEMLDLDEVARVVDAITAASYIDIYGASSSGLAAQDLSHKLRRIGYFTNSWSDPHLSLTSAAVLRDDTVAIAFSHSGETEESVSALEVAKGSGAFTVAVTNFPSSSLAARADAVLLTSSRETRHRYGAMSSRMAQLMIVDVILLGASRRDPGTVTEALAATMLAVESRKIPADDER